MTDRTLDMITSPSSLTATIGDYLYIKWDGVRWRYDPDGGTIEDRIYVDITATEHFKNSFGSYGLNIVGILLNHPIDRASASAHTASIHDEFGTSAPDALVTDQNKRYRVEYIAPTGSEFWDYFAVTEVIAQAPDPEVDQTENAIVNGIFDMTVGNYVYIKWSVDKWQFDPIPSDGIASNYPYMKAGYNTSLFFTPININEGSAASSTHPNSNFYTGSQITSSFDLSPVTLGASSLERTGVRYKVEAIEVTTNTNTFWSFFEITADIAPVVDDSDKTVDAINTGIYDIQVSNHIFIRWSGTDWRLDPATSVNGGYTRIKARTAIGEVALIFVADNDDESQENMHPSSINRDLGPPVISTISDLHSFDGASDPVALVTDQDVRYRLSPILPLVDSINFWDFFEVTIDEPVCYSGNSLVETPDGPRAVRTIRKGDQVLSITRGFVEVLDNIVSDSSPLGNYILFRAGTFGTAPSHDFYITKGHPVLMDGVERLVEDLPGGEIVDHGESEKVYNIATSEREYIKINGMDVCTWNYNWWLDCEMSKRVKWRSN